MKQRDQYLKEKINWVNARWIGGKMSEFVALRRKACSCLIDDDDENEKPKGRNMFIIKENLKFKDYKNCLTGNQYEKK